MSEMLPLEQGTIEHVECADGALTLIEMGCCPGEVVTMAHVAPYRGPMAIVSAGRKMALRRTAAALIWVSPTTAAVVQNSPLEPASVLQANS